jgi:hypothetical protein
MKWCKLLRAFKELFSFIFLPSAVYIQYSEGWYEQSRLLCKFLGHRFVLDSQRESDTLPNGIILQMLLQGFLLAF